MALAFISAPLATHQETSSRNLECALLHDGCGANSTQKRVYIVRLGVSVCVWVRVHVANVYEPSRGADRRKGERESPLFGLRLCWQTVNFMWPFVERQNHEEAQARSVEVGLGESG